jgi:muramidase (phage lysozyme)
MDQELRDLVEQMRQLIPVLQGMSKPPGATVDSPADKMTRGVDRMVVALGQLAVKLDTTKKTRRDEEEAVKKFAKAVEKTADNIEEENKERQKVTDALEKESKAREEAIKEATRRNNLSQQGREQEDKERAKYEAEQRNRNTKLSIEQNRRSSSSSKDLFDSLSSTGGSAEILKNKFLNLGGDSLTAQSGLQLFSAGLSGTTKSLTTFASGLINGERGAQLSAKALNDFATPILNVASSIGTLLTVLSFIPGPVGILTRGARMAGAAVFGLGSAAGKAALKFNEIGAKQLDTLVKSFNDASGAGVSLTGGLEGTLDLMHTLNMTTADAAQFQEMLSKNNKQLALLGGTAGVGAKRFAEVSGALVKSDIGQTFEIMGITQQEQREAALLYMSIQARTGQLQLKNTEKLIEESARFVHELDQAAQLTGATRREQQEAREAAMAEVRFRAALIDAQQRGDTADMAQLKVAERAAAIAKSLGDEKGFLGILQQAAGQGALTTPEAIAAEQTYRISEILAQPNITDQQILEHLAKNADLNLQSLAGTNRLIGGIDALQTGIVGMDNSVKRQNALAQEAAKAGFTGPEAITNYLKQEEKKRKQPGGDLTLMVSAGRAQQAAAQIMEQGIATFNSAADINKAASEAFANAVAIFGSAVGANPVPGGTPTFGGVPVESGVRLPPTPEAAQAKVDQADAKIKEVGDKIKEQEKKLAEAKTNVEKDKAEAEIKRLKKEKDDADKAKNAADLGKKAEENRRRLEDAHKRSKSGAAPGSAPATTTPPAAPGSAPATTTPPAAPGSAPAAKSAAGRAPAASPAAPSSAPAAKPAAPSSAPAAKPAAPSSAPAAKPAAPGSTPNNPAPLPPMPPGANPATAEKPTASIIKILDLIGRAESRGNYNVLVGGEINPDLTNMTIAEVQDFQGKMVRAGHESTAVGKYQIIQETLRTLLTRGVVNPNETFSPSTQDKLAIALLNEKGWPKFQSGKMSADQMADAIAQVWAGFPLADGMSYYRGVGTNKATISRQEVLTALTDVPKAKDGGMFQGPMSGYPAVLHGKEAVIPLKNGAVPVMMPALDELVLSNKNMEQQMSDMRKEMAQVMRELVDSIQIMKESGSQQRMIQLLESMSRSQQTTAVASQRMAQLASN